MTPRPKWGPFQNNFRLYAKLGPCIFKKMALVQMSHLYSISTGSLTLYNWRWCNVYAHIYPINFHTAITLHVIYVQYTAKYAEADLMPSMTHFEILVLLQEQFFLYGLILFWEGPKKYSPPSGGAGKWSDSRFSPSALPN